MKRITSYVADGLIVTGIGTAFLVLVTGSVGRAGFLLTLLVAFLFVSVVDVLEFILRCYAASFPEEAS